MRDTPRTDVETYELDYKVLIPREGGEWVKADFARELEREVAALKAERDEAHSLICTWWVNLVGVVDDGEIMYAMTSDGRCSMNDAHKRAFLAATAKKGGGA